MQVVQEYERAVIFRLGRITAGGAKGPGIVIGLLPTFSFIVYSAGARCCVHNAPPVVTNSCLPPGRRKANVLLAKVCLHCTKPGVARSFLTVASNLEAAPESPQRQHGGGHLDSSGPLVVSMR